MYFGTYKIDISTGLGLPWTFLNDAEVKNQDIQIQGRYGTTKFTVDGQSALLDLAISGNFISNDTIIIQPMNGTFC